MSVAGVEHQQILLLVCVACVTIQSLYVAQSVVPLTGAELLDWICGSPSKSACAASDCVSAPTAIPVAVPTDTVSASR